MLIMGQVLFEAFYIYYWFTSQNSSIIISTLEMCKLWVSFHCLFQGTQLACPGARTRIQSLSDVALHHFVHALSHFVLFSLCITCINTKLNTLSLLENFSQAWEHWFKPSWSFSHLGGFFNLMVSIIIYLKNNGHT